MIDKGVAKQKFLDAYKKVIKDKLGIEPAADAAGIEALGAGVEALIDYILVANEVQVTQLTVDPGSHSLIPPNVGIGKLK